MEKAWLRETLTTKNTIRSYIDEQTFSIDNPIRAQVFVLKPIKFNFTLHYRTSDMNYDIYRFFYICYFAMLKTISRMTEEGEVN